LFWQEVAEKYSEVKEEFDELDFQHNMFRFVDLSMKLEHSWNKLHEIYKGLTQSFTEVYEIIKKWQS